MLLRKAKLVCYPSPATVPAVVWGWIITVSIICYMKLSNQLPSEPAARSRHYLFITPSYYQLHNVFTAEAGKVYDKVIPRVNHYSGLDQQSRVLHFTNRNHTIGCRDYVPYRGRRISPKATNYHMLAAGPDTKLCVLANFKYNFFKLTWKKRKWNSKNWQKNGVFHSSTKCWLWLLPAFSFFLQNSGWA